MNEGVHGWVSERSSGRRDGSRGAVLGSEHGISR